MQNSLRDSFAAALIAIFSCAASPQPATTMFTFVIPWDNASKPVVARDGHFFDQMGVVWASLELILHSARIFPRKRKLKRLRHKCANMALMPVAATLFLSGSAPTVATIKTLQVPY